MWPRWGNGEIRAHLNGADGHAVLRDDAKENRMVDRAMKSAARGRLLRQGDVLLVPVDD